MRNVVIMFLVLFSNNIHSQCVGCNMFFYKIKFSLFENKDKLSKDSFAVEQDTIKFEQKNDSTFFSEKYIVSISKIKYKNLLKTIFIDNWNNKLIDNYIIQTNYSSAFSDGCNGLEYLIKENDVLITIKKENRQMRILLRLYDGKEGVTSNEVNLFIPFCDGFFEVTNTLNPRLIAIKED